MFFLKKKKCRKCVRVTVSVLFSSIYDGRGFDSLYDLTHPVSYRFLRTPQKRKSESWEMNLAETFGCMKFHYYSFKKKKKKKKSY